MKTKKNKCGMKGTFTHYYGDYSGKKEKIRWRQGVWGT
jgi:hypothetical protein